MKIAKTPQEVYDNGPLAEPFKSDGLWFYKTKTSLYVLRVTDGPFDQSGNLTKQPIWVWLGNNGSFV